MTNLRSNRTRQNHAAVLLEAGTEANASHKRMAKELDREAGMSQQVFNVLATLALLTIFSLAAYWGTLIPHTHR